MLCPAGALTYWAAVLVPIGPRAAPRCHSLDPLNVVRTCGRRVTGLLDQCCPLGAMRLDVVTMKHQCGHMCHLMAEHARKLALRRRRQICMQQHLATRRIAAAEH